MALLSLIGRLGLDTSSFEGGLKKAESSALGFAASLKTKVGGALAAAFSVAYLEELVSKIQEHAKDVKDLSEQYSLTTDEVQRLEKATGRLGLRFDSIAGAIGRIQKARAIAMAGGESGEGAVETFRQMGVKREDVLNPTVSVVDIMRQMGGADASSAKAQFDLLGKSAITVRNVMVELSQLGPVRIMSREDIEAIDKAEKNLKKLAGERNAILAPLVGMHAKGSVKVSEALNKQLVENPLSLVQTGGLRFAYAYLSGILKTQKKEKPDPVIEEREKQKKAFEAQMAEQQKQAAIKNATMAAAPKAFGTIGPGNGSMASVGGYFFGSDVNQAVIANTKKTVTHLEKIAANTDKFAAALGPEGN